MSDSKEKDSKSKQKKKTKVINYAAQIPDDLQPHYRNDNPDTFQHPFRALAVAPSGFGKTTAVLNYILNPEMAVSWDEIWIFAKNIQEPIYQSLIRKLDKMEEKLRLDEPDYQGRLVHYRDTLADLPELKEMESVDVVQRLFILDDMISDAKDVENRKKLVDWFTQSRKFNISIFFLTQKASSVDRVIRMNCPIAMVWNFASPTEVSNLAMDYAGGLDTKEFKTLINDVVSERFRYLVVDTTQPPERLFRNGPDDFIDPNEYISDAKPKPNPKSKKKKQV